MEPPPTPSPSGRLIPGTSRRRQRRERARGFFAIGIAGGKTPENLGQLWRHAVLYEAAFIFTVGRRYTRDQACDTPVAWRHVPLIHFSSVDDLVDHLPKSTPLVGVELHEAAWGLRTYAHPERACYLLGAEDHGLSGVQLERCHQLLRIDTPLPFSMNVATAGAIVMHDRFVKVAIGTRQR